MVAVQAEGCAPIVRAFETRRSARAERWEGARHARGGLRVPAAVGDMLILDALRESGGTAVAVSEEALTEAQGLAGRLMGVVRGAGERAPRSRRCGCCASAATSALPRASSCSTAGSARSTRRPPGSTSTAAG